MSSNVEVVIAIGAIAGAVITAIISLINMIISKDQKTTEFRQEWINSVRIEIANLIAEVDARHSEGLLVKHYLEIKEVAKAREILSNMTVISSKHIKNIGTKLSLYLNPVEHEKLLHLMSELRQTPTL